MSRFTKFFDLSQPVYDHCPGWPTYEPTIVKYEATYEKDQFNAEQIRMNSHTGTHLDVPFHLFPEGKTLEQVDIAAFQGEAIIIDLKGKIEAKQGITVAHMEPYADEIKKDSIAILCTGWGQKRSHEKEYMYDWPYLTGEAAKWLKEKGIKGIAIDAMSLGGWYDGTGRPCHVEMLSAGIWILEEVVIPEELVEIEKCYLMAFPIKLKGFSGGPVRAVAAI